MKKFKERIKAETKLVSFLKYLFVISNIFEITKNICIFFLTKQNSRALKLYLTKNLSISFDVEIFYYFICWKIVEINFKLILNYSTRSYSCKFLIYVFLITTQTLRDELQKMTKTAIRRKENLKDRKLKKKQAKNGDVFEEVSTLYMYVRLLPDFNFFFQNFYKFIIFYFLMYSTFFCLRFQFRFRNLVCWLIVVSSIIYNKPSMIQSLF